MIINIIGCLTLLAVVLRTTLYYRDTRSEQRGKLAAEIKDVERSIDDAAILAVRALAQTDSIDLEQADVRALEWNMHDPSSMLDMLKQHLKRLNDFRPLPSRVRKSRRALTEAWWHASRVSLYAQAILATTAGIASGNGTEEVRFIPLSELGPRNP